MTEGSRYRWVLVASLFFILLLFWGSYYSFGVFLKPLAQEFGWSRAATSGPFALSLVLQGFVGILAGALTDRYGPRPILLGGTLAASLGYLLMARLSSLTELYLYFGVLVGLGTSASYVVPVATIPRYFDKQRGLALGIALAGIGVGQMTFPPLTSFLTQGQGWRYAFLVVGLVLGVGGILASLVPRPYPREASTRGSTPWQAMGGLRFWALFAIWFMAALPLQIVMVHIVPYATDKGFGPGAAALTLTIMGLTVTLARVAVGGVSDRMGNRPVYFACLGLQFLIMFWLIRGGSLGGLYLAALVFGIGYGGAAVVFAKIVAEVYGLASLGAIMGLLGLGWYLGAALGAPLAGWVFDLRHSYSLAFLAGGTALGLALILGYAVLHRPPPLGAGSGEEIR